MLNQRAIKMLVDKIYSVPELKGCIVGHYGQNQCSVAHPGLTPSKNYGRVAVIIEEVDETDPTVNRDTQMWADRPNESPAGAPNPRIVTNRSRANSELIGAGLACGLTIVSAVGVFAGAAAEVPTAGTSTFLVVAAWTGMITQAIQCVDGLVRVTEAKNNPDSNSLQTWEDNNVYNVGMKIVDAVGLVAGLAALPAASRNLYAILKRQKSFVERGITEATLKNMNRTERAALIKELMEEASKTKEGREALLKAAKEVGVGAKSLQGTSLSVRNAARMTKAISDETAFRLNRALLEVIGTVVDASTNILPEQQVGVASGTLNILIHLVDGGLR